MTGFTPPGAKQFIANVIERLAGVVLNAPVGAGVKSAYVELDASVAHRCVGLVIALYSMATVADKYSIWIATGPGGSEVDIIKGLIFVKDSLVGNNTVTYRFPYEIVAGTRLSACISNDGAAAGSVGMAVWEEQVA